MLALGLLAQGAAQAEVVYANDFESGLVSGWTSQTGQAPGINVTPSGQGFLGWAGSTQALNGVSHEGLTLTIPVPRPGLVQVDFDLYLINSWDGNSGIWGPDRFEIFVERDRPAFETTFANVAGLTQAYPGQFGGGRTGDNPAKAGADAIDALGYSPFTVSGDAVYRLSFSAPVTDGTLAFSVRDLSNGAGLADESWGLDNVRVSTVPEPGSLLLLAAGMAAMAMYGGSTAAWRRRTPSRRAGPDAQ